MTTNRTRVSGLTMVIDSGLPTATFADVLASYGSQIDFVKLGWGTALATPDLALKLELVEDAGIDYFFGGTLFEHYLHCGRLEGYLDWLRDLGTCYVEVSNGTIPLDQHAKADHVHALSAEFAVLAEVGSKDGATSDAMSPDGWVSAVAEDLAAGASYVITEARESGRCGIALADGTMRRDVFDALVASVPLSSLLFEAPTKELQVQLISALGPQVNLGNINPFDVIAVTTLRRGLRSDTLLQLAGSAARLAGEGGRRRWPQDEPRSTVSTSHSAA